MAGTYGDRSAGCDRGWGTQCGWYRTVCKDRAERTGALSDRTAVLRCGREKLRRDDPHDL